MTFAIPPDARPRRASSPKLHSNQYFACSLSIRRFAKVPQWGAMSQIEHLEFAGTGWRRPALSWACRTMRCPMDRFFRTCAVVAASVLLSATAPAVAAEQAPVATDVSANGSALKHHRASPIRHVRHVTAAAPLQRNLGCSGEWCGRQVVLFIGVGF